MSRPLAPARRTLRRLQLKVLAWITALALAVGTAYADTNADIARGAAAFYEVYLNARPAGVPPAKVRAKFAPVISRTLAQLLERADTAERRYAKITKRRVPPLVEGDLFTSLFEGAQSFNLRGCERDSGAAVCTVELRYDSTTDKAVTLWSDKLTLVRNGKHWVVDDIAFGGNWQFMHKGHLRELLRKVIRDGANARP